MNTRSIAAAAEVIHAAEKKSTVPVSLAIALEAAGLLQSPAAVAELTEARTKLGIAEQAIDDLRTLLVERDKQIAGLLADEVDLSDDQPGAPR